MSDRGSSTNSEPVKSPKYIDLKDFPSVRKKVEMQLRAPIGRRSYRSLDELADTTEFREMLNREFPAAASEWDDGVSRRNFMKLMGASLALAGLTTACAPRPVEKIVPYVQQPEHLVPGKPLFYATAMPWGGFAKGVLVEQHEGRPTKIEGNPDHPSSLGAADIWGQGSVLNLYDPDRSKLLTRNGNASSWGTFTGAIKDALTFDDWNDKKLNRRTSPVRVRILTETTTSPTLTAQIQALQSMPNLQVQWHAHDAVGRDNIRAGAKQAFGEDVEPIYAFDAAATVVSLDSNFFMEDPGSLRFANDYMRNRRVRAQDPDLKRHSPAVRLYVVESSPTVVGAMADHKARVKPDEVHAFAAALHKAVAAGKAEGITVPAAAQGWFAKLVEELLANKGKSLVIVGEYAPVEVHVLAHAINDALGNIARNAAEAGTSAKSEVTESATRPAGTIVAVPEGKIAGKGKPVSLIPVVETSPAGSGESLKSLIDAINGNQVDFLLMLGGNPAYTSPADLNFEAVLQSIYPVNDKKEKQFDKGKLFAVYMGLFEDETARQVEWHVPETHYLEAWGDLRAHDGTASIVQPLISPLYLASKSPIELLAAIIDRAMNVSGATTQPATTQPATTQPADIRGASSNGYEIVRSYWANWHGQSGGGDFEKFWTKSLYNGVIANSAATYAPKAVTFKGDADKASIVPAVGAFTLIIRPDPNIWDGHLANNSWLQELPKPLTKITWDNALMISPNAAAAMQDANHHPLADDAQGHVFRVKFSEANGKTVDITIAGRTLKGVPVWVLPGHPDKCATLHLGYGRHAPGLRVGGPDNGNVGFNAYSIRTSKSPWIDSSATVAVAGGEYKLAVTQNHQVINRDINENRELVKTGSSIHHAVEKFLEDFDERSGKPVPKTAQAGASNEMLRTFDPGKNLDMARRIGLPILPDDPNNSPVGLFPEQPDHINEHQNGRNRDDSYAAWGMVIDQTACIGCQACVMACNAENNVPVVGKEQVINEREMHWLRIDTYYIGKPLKGDAEGTAYEVDITDPDGTYFQPLPCQQCEKAPCELVCPVGATVHSKEGLNDMAYNRCVGTRYCSNNCPYKVRRFNFLKYTDDTTPVLKLLRNPEVTVRSRGVMEKCTYCVQRISRGRIEAKKAEVKLLDAGASREVGQDKFNEVLRGIQTACQQSCPTQAIIFGNMADPKSKVYQLKREPVGFHYGLLTEVNTRPRTSYLARIENPQGNVSGEQPEGEKAGEHA